MILEENNLQTVHLRVKLILHRVDSLTCTPKKYSNHLRSHLRKQIRRNFLRSISLLYKILPTSLGTCKPTFFYFLYITADVKQYHEALFLSYRPRCSMQSMISQFCNTNCTHSIFRVIEARVDF